jgi:hypothetical protein
MRGPFSSLLPPDEPLLASGEAEPGSVNGPLAGILELCAMFGWVPALFILGRIDGLALRLAAVFLPPVVLFLLSRSPLRRIGRPREWLGVTSRRVLLWRRPRGFSAAPRIESTPLADIAGVELTQDSWDRRRGTHQFIIHGHNYTGQRTLARVHNAEQLRDALVSASPIAPAEAPEPAIAPLPRDFLPPTAPPIDFRP